MEVISRDRALRVIRFLTVGSTVAIIDFSLVWLLHFFLPPLVAVSIAYLTAVTCHFLLNKFWVFRCRRSDYGKQLAQYGFNAFCCWLVTLAMVRLCLGTFTTNILVAKLCAIPPATLLGFLGLQLMVFRHRPPQRELDVRSHGGHGDKVHTADTAGHGDHGGPKNATNGQGRRCPAVP